jgi:hypothetical protein
MVSRRQMIASAGSAIAVWAMVLSTSAQIASPYTMPDPTPAGPQDGASRSGSVTAPPQANNEISQDEIPLPPPPPVDSNPLQQTGKEKKSWVEMTPEEILGIAPDKKSTDGKSPGLTSGDSDQSGGHDFLQEDRLRPGGKNNTGESGADDSSWGQGAMPDGQQRLGTMPANAPGSLFNHLLENSRNGISHQFSDSAWTGVFATPPPPPPPTADHLAEMAAFNEMLNPSDSAEQRKSGSFSDQPAVVPSDPDVAPAPAKYDPDGGSYTPVDDGIGRPKKLDPLPTATSGLSGYQTPYGAPTWAPKPPPWTLSTPQLFVEPQRHF